MLFIEHFRTLELLRIWTKLRQEGFPSAFTNFATGGLASSPIKNYPPCIAYVLPLITVLVDAKRREFTSLRFHVLGSGQLSDLFMHALFQHHVSAVHDIALRITCDSTILYSYYARGHAFAVPDHNSRRIVSHSLVSSEFSRSNPEFTAFCNQTRDVLEPYGIAPLTPRHELFYRPYRGRLAMTPLAYAYGLLINMDAYRVAEDWCNQAVQTVYPLYQSGESEACIAEITSVLSGLSGRRVTDTTKVKAKQIHESLRRLDELDFDYVRYVVGHYLGVK
jgi:hypothetical protein